MCHPLLPIRFTEGIGEGRTSVIELRLHIRRTQVQSLESAVKVSQVEDDVKEYSMGNPGDPLTVSAGIRKRGGKVRKP